MKGKAGHPYEYPDSYINFLSVIYHIFEIPYRQLEGFIRALSRYCDLKPIDHSTIHERSMKLNLHEDLCDTDDMTISVDASGIKVSNRGEWMREKWKRKRGYLKIHFAVDVKTKNIISFLSKLRMKVSGIARNSRIWLRKQMNLERYCE